MVVFDCQRDLLRRVRRRCFDVRKGDRQAVLVHPCSGIRERPAHAKYNADCDHVLLSEGIQHLFALRVDDRRLIKNFDGNVLPNRINGLREVTCYHLRDRGIKGAIKRELHGNAVQGIRRRALHIRLEKWAAIIILQTTQSGACLHGCDNPGRHPARRFNL